jgi:hypothetical protein
VKTLEVPGRIREWAFVLFFSERERDKENKREMSGV